MTADREVRIAAVGDLHVGTAERDIPLGWSEGVEEQADILLLAGDLTRRGRADEAAALAAELVEVPIPIVAVLGNHDLESDTPHVVRAVLEEVGVTVLEGDTATVPVNGTRVGVAGTIGFGAGFRGAICSDFGEPELKALVARSRRLAADLGSALGRLRTDLRIALTHYAPVRDTLAGEPLEIYPFLGSSFLADAVDGATADIVIHGHAHLGTETGRTPRGVPVRNVAHPVIAAPYRVYRFTDPGGGLALSGSAPSPLAGGGA